ncbi:MAG TPA: enoyl-CoA hydratase-related protein [Verrucomicrobiae bacterium]|nr:enoyl-CoA hydratase-related protein [Verrucomicrobiae bacterium]
MQRRYIELIRRDAVVLAVLQRPEALNALNVEFIGELREVISQLAADPAVAGVVVTGAGRSFCAGADISEMAAMSPPEAAEFAARGQRALLELEDCGKPVLAAVNGYCMGGGLEVALACDFIVASESASFAFPEIGLGIIPGFGGTQRLARLVGKGRAKELVFSGERVDAAEAARIGLVNHVFPAHEFVERSVALMQRICARGSYPLRLAKQVIDAGYDLDLANACLLERDSFALCFASPDQKEGMAAFLEKRPAVFRSPAVDKP